MTSDQLRSLRANAVTHWERFWFDQIPPHIYALVRIAVGGVALAELLVLGDMETFWDLGGLVADTPAAGLRPFLLEQGLGPVAGRLLYAFCVAAFGALTVGFRSSLAVPLSFVAALLQVAWNPLPLSSAHQVIRVTLFCLIWADCGAVWSLDSWLARRRGAESVIGTSSIAPLRLLRFQIALIYLNSGLWKLYNPTWRDGSAVHYVLNENVFQRFTDIVPASLDWVTTVLTYTTLVWEIGFAVFVLFPATRVLVLLLGIGMHLGMLATMEIGSFSYVMIAAYTAFLPPATVPTLPRRLLNLRGRRRAAESPGWTAPHHPVSEKKTTARL